MATYEGAWDCPNCGRKRNRGPDKHCGGCGVPRSPEVPFYLPEDAREVTEEAELARAQAGPDWTCAYCQGDNPATDAFCVNCGAGRDGSKPREVIEHRPPAAPAKQSKEPRALRGCLGCLAAFAFFCLFLMWATAPRKADLKVLAHLWQRTIQTEVLGDVDESAWEGEVPPGARIRERRRELHHTERIQTGVQTRTREVSERVQSGTRRVKVGRRDKGNGYFEDIYEERPEYKTVKRTERYQEPVYREEPVYRTKVYYTIKKWAQSAPVEATGVGLDPRWPEFRASGEKREKARIEVYTLSLQDQEKKSYTYTAKNEQEWRSFKDGETYHGKVSGDKCVELQP